MVLTAFGSVDQAISVVHDLKAALTIGDCQGHTGFGGLRMTTDVGDRLSDDGHCG